MNGFSVRTVDYHTGGEPFRIVTEVPPLKAATVANKRIEAMNSTEVDGLRVLLCSEPRGHADMYGGFITEPDDPGAHFGVLFWHKDGFSTACGHGTIALGAWAIRSGKVAVDPSGQTDVVIDVPSGRVTARATTDQSGEVTSVDFLNVASYVLHEQVTVPTSRGPINTLIAFGGAIYAHVDAATVGLRVEPSDLTALIALAREIKAALADTPEAEHPSDPRLSGIYGVIFYEDHGTDATGNLLQHNVTVFADGEVDRSPCGSGTCSRLAALAPQVGEGKVLIHTSIVGSQFIGRIVGQETMEGHNCIIPVVTGNAFQTGSHTFVVDPADPLTPGFILR
ncbi:MAG: proline racemase family protein [Marmoricola sp.]